VQNFRDRLTDADVFQNIQRGIVNAVNIMVTQGLVGAAGHTRLYGLATHAFCAQRAPGFSSACAPAAP
jgi:hypothetical protein